MSPAEKLSAQIAKKRPKHRSRSYEAGLRCLIHDKRLALRLTLGDIEKATGIKICTVNRAELGSDLLLSNAKALAVFFGCSIEELWPTKEYP
jgi:hypothetical protein